MTDTTERELTVVILIDALGWEIVQHFGFAGTLLPRSGPLGTVLGYSSAAIPSLLSGTKPSDHGSWAMYRYSPSTSPFKLLRFLPNLPHPLEWRLRGWIRRILDRRNVIKSYYDLYEIPPRMLSYFDVATRTDPYTPGGLRRETLFDVLEAKKVRYRQWNYRTPESENFRELLSLVGSDKQLLFLYTAELDALMHRVGIFHDDVREKLAWYEKRLAEIVAASRNDGRPLRLYLFSDHGMTDVSGSVNLMREVESWGFRLGTDIVAFYDSTMARFWCDVETRIRLSERLNQTGWGRVMSDEELETYGCRFEDGSYGQVIYLLTPGRLIVPSFMGSETIAAMHGYDPDDRFSKGCFMSNEPSDRCPGSILDLKSYLLERIGGTGE